MKTIIKLDNIQAAYEGAPVIEGATFCINERDYVGIVGPNGGGKTTLMRVLLGIIKPTKGKVSYFSDGKEVNHITMGYLPQYNKIDKAFPISVYDVILTGLARPGGILGRYSKEQKEQADRIIRKMELQGLEKRSISDLSGGQLQRILLARALVSQPDVLVLDEPNTYIDELYQEQMYDLLDTLNKECAVVLVSHDIDALLGKAGKVVCVNKTVHLYDKETTDAQSIKKHIRDTFLQ